MVSPFFHLLVSVAVVRAGCGVGVFWCDVPVGTESQFHPLSTIANEAFDIHQLEGRGNGLDSLLRPRDVRRLGDVLGHPIDAIGEAGWPDFVGTEIVPTSFSPSRSAWIPNWQLHLVGGGVTNARLEDWYRAHGCASPFLPALLSSYTGHFLNEAVEIRGMPDNRPTDPVADIYLFDAAGIALFHVPVIRTFFTSTVEVAHWPLQPTLGLDRGTVENAGQYYAIKAPLPATEEWKLFYHFGLGNIGGLSRRLGSTDAISLGVGAHASSIEAVDRTTNTVVMAPKIGLFWDRGNSLLASAFWNGQSVNRFSVQLYPGVVPTGPIPLGAWIAFDDEGYSTVGFVAVVGLGIGLSRNQGG